MIRARLQCVANFGDAQVCQFFGNVRQTLGEHVTLEDLRLERREQARGTCDPLDRAALGVEECDTDGIDLARLAQRVEVALDTAVPGLAGEAEKIQRNFRDEYIETDRRSPAIVEHELGGQEITLFLPVAPARRCL